MMMLRPYVVDLAGSNANKTFFWWRAKRGGTYEWHTP